MQNPLCNFKAVTATERIVEATASKKRKKWKSDLKIIPWKGITSRINTSALHNFIAKLSRR